MKKILIIDYGMGNIQSVINAFKKLNIYTAVSRSKDDIIKYNNYILPGVGSFGEAMKKINKYNIKDILVDQIVNNKKPIIGICLGMQLFSSFSEENGYHKGLNLIKGNVISLAKKKNLFNNNVGWGNILFNKKNNLFYNIKKNNNFYFDHSYYFQTSKKNVISYINHKNEIIPVVVKKNNILGLQFHPEKSQNIGLKLLKNISEYHLR